MRIKLAVITIFFTMMTINCPIYAQELKEELLSTLPDRSVSSTVGKPFDHSHIIWDQSLKQFVINAGHESQVNYSGIIKSPQLIQSYLDQIGSVDQATFQGFSERQKIAFLINAYNALTITLIVNNYPVSSIKKLGGWFSSPWKIQFFELFGKKHSLDDIEQEMLRKQFSEPRIHFALVCASKGCPPLRDEAFVADKLDEQLDAATDNFLSDTNKNYISPKDKTLYVSSIFKWYGDDFDAKYESVKAFIISHIPETSLTDITTYSLSFLPYDWNLNDAENQR